jgi:hypothetical protein
MGDYADDEIFRGLDESWGLDRRMRRWPAEKRRRAPPSKPGDFEDLTK